MPGFTHQRFAGHQEIRVNRDLSLPLIMSAMSVVSQDDEFERLHAIWIFGADVNPLPFTDFDQVLTMLQRLYAGVSPQKKVALVAESSFNLGMARMFRDVATALPVEFDAFSSYDDARGWLGV